MTTSLSVRHITQTLCYAMVLAALLGSGEGLGSPRRQSISVPGPAGAALREAAPPSERSFFALAGNLPKSADDLAMRSLVACDVNNDIVLDLLERLSASPERLLCKSTTEVFDRSGSLRCPDETPCSNMKTHLKDHLVDTHTFGKTITPAKMRATCLWHLKQKPNAILFAPKSMGWAAMPELVEIIIK